MFRKELIPNKIAATLLIVSNALGAWYLKDGSALIFVLILGLPLFFAKENYIG